MVSLFWNTPPDGNPIFFQAKVATTALQFNYKHHNLFAHPGQSPMWRNARPRLNIKTVFPGMGIPMLKIGRSQVRLIFNMGIPILVRPHCCIETPTPQVFLNIITSHSLIPDLSWTTQCKPRWRHFCLPTRVHQTVPSNMHPKEGRPIYCHPQSAGLQPFWATNRYIFSPGLYPTDKEMWRNQKESSFC